ncbi:MAG: PDDEXK family nuclease [Desulfobulbia bacterium]
MERLYEIKPKKTNYGGTLYRSRIEARWAVFFDSLGIEHEYEPFCEEVGSDFTSLYYLPDFYLPSQNIFIEIKPGQPEEIEKIKAAYWCNDIQEIVILFNLNPPTEKFENGWLFEFHNIVQKVSIRKSWWWGECPKCGHVDMAEFAYITSCGCYTIDDYNDLYEREELSGENYTKRLSRSKRLMKAYSNARNYEFKLGSNCQVKQVRYQSSLF